MKVRLDTFGLSLYKLEFSNEDDIIQGGVRKNPLDRRFKREPNSIRRLRDLCWDSSGQRPDRICRSFEKWLCLIKGDKELERNVTHFVELKPWNEKPWSTRSKIQEYTGQRLINGKNGWKRTSWIRTTNAPYSPNQLKQLAGSSGASCWTRLALSKLPLFHRSKSMEESQSLDSGKPEDLLALGEDLAYFQPYTVFMIKAMN